jgi:hypothetical protein
MTTLFDVAMRVHRELGQLTEGVATGGSTSTILDANERTDKDDDYWNGGTAYVVYDAAGAGAAPEGEFSFISDFTKTTGTIALRTTLTAAVAAGDWYAVAKKRYSLYKVTECINAALQRFGDIVTIDTTSLDTAASQTELTLPVAASVDLREVWIQGRVSDDDDNKWIKIHNWRTKKTAGGTGDTLILPVQYVADRDIMLVYLAPHAQVRVASATIDESVPVDRLVYEAALRCLMWRFSKVGDGDPRLVEQIVDMRQLVAEARVMHPHKKPRKTGNIFKVDGGFFTRDAPDPS